MLLSTRQLQQTTDPWWIIGSVALALHGVDPGPIGDIDFLMSQRDGLAFAKRFGLENSAGAGNELFCSTLLLKQKIERVDVEFMAGLHIRKDGKWQEVLPQTRRPVNIGNSTVFVPEKTELMAILHSFGRDKDIARAKKLRSQITKETSHK